MTRETFMQLFALSGMLAVVGFLNLDMFYQLLKGLVIVFSFMVVGAFCGHMLGLK